MIKLLLTKHSIIALCVMLSFGFISCESDVLLTVPDGDSKLFAFSEINPDDKIQVKVNTTIGINTDDQFYYPDQSGAKITLYKDGIALENPGFRYIKSKKAFVSQGSYRPEVGARYGLHVELVDISRNIVDIYAETIIPERDSLSDVKIRKIDNHTVSVNCDLSSLSNDYFILVPKFVSKNGLALNTSISDIENSNKSLKSILRENKLLVSKKVLNSNIVFELTSSEFLNDHEVDIEIRSITKEAYDYYVKYSLQLVSQNLSLAEPIIGFSNFENGLGLFAGYSKSSTSISIP